MKKKQLTYFLLVVVAVIWGLIFIRLFDSVSAEEEATPMTIQRNKNPLDNAAVPDTFSLLANYRDPFLGGQPSSRVSAAKPALKPGPTLIAPPPEPKIPVDWSVITYLGIINNSKNNKRIALIHFKGKEYMVSEGEMIDDVKIIRNLKDSLLVSYQAEKKYLKPPKRTF